LYQYNNNPNPHLKNDSSMNTISYLYQYNIREYEFINIHINPIFISQTLCRPVCSMYNVVLCSMRNVIAT